MNKIRHHIFICEECGFDWCVFSLVATIFTVLPALLIVILLPYPWQQDVLLIVGIWVLFLLGILGDYWWECG